MWLQIKKAVTQAGQEFDHESFGQEAVAHYAQDDLPLQRILAMLLATAFQMPENSMSESYQYKASSPKGC